MAPKQGTTTRARHRVGRWIVGVLVVLAVLAAAPPAAAWIGSAGRNFGVDDVAPHDVAIVFGAGVQPDKTPSPYLAARLDLAVGLYEAGKAKVILVSGSNPEVSYNEPAAMLAYLVGHGVPEGKIVLDYAGNDTYGTCVRASRIFGVTSAILVSQSYHMPRAITTCRMVGVDVVGVGDDTVAAAYPDKWGVFSVREAPAYYKMALDVLAQREPILGEPDASVTKALGG